MSTYTNLKNVVKETVEVNYAADDRSTNQKVKFLNEENVFWGTLHGKIGTDVKIDDTSLSGATITKSTLKDVTLSGVSLDNCQALEDLSATDEVLDTKIDASLAEAKYDIGLVDSSLKVVSADLQYKIDHIDKDYHIVSAYSTLLTELSAKEISDVANLQGQINKTASDIVACGLKERQDFALLSAAQISTVEDLSVELKGDIAANKALIDEISGKLDDSSESIKFLSNDISVRLNEVDDRRAVGDFNLKLDINNLSTDVDRKLSNIEALSDLNKLISAFNDLSGFTISSIDGISAEVSSSLLSMTNEISAISAMTSGFDARLDLNDAAIHALNIHHDVDMVNTHHVISNIIDDIKELSSKTPSGVGDLSTKVEQLSGKFEGIVDIVSDISGVGQSAATSCYNISAAAQSQFGTVNADIQSVKRSIVGSVEYKGHITLSSTVVQPFKQTLKEYLEHTTGKEIPADYALSNGWMWQTTIDDGDIYFDGVDISVYNRDYVLIHNRNEAFTYLSDVAKSTIDVIRGVDNNVVTHDELKLSCDDLVGKAGLSTYNLSVTLSVEVADKFVKKTDNEALSILVNTIANDYLTSTDKNTIIGSAGLSVYNAKTALSNEVKSSFVTTAVNTALSTTVAGISADYLTSTDKNTIIGSAGLSVYNAKTALSNEVKSSFVTTAVNTALSTTVAGISADYLTSTDKNSIVGSAGLSVYNAKTALSNEVKNSFVTTAINTALSTTVAGISVDYLTSTDKNSIIGSAGLSAYNLSSQVQKDIAAIKSSIKACLSSFKDMTPDAEGDFDCNLNTVVSAMINLYNFVKA